MTRAEVRSPAAARPAVEAPPPRAPVKWSYLTDFICGEGTDQMCPGPAVPQYRNNNHNPNGGSAHLDPNGHLVVPPDTQLPSLVPFDIGK